MKSARGGLAFSHLFYADDLVLFARVDLANCLTIREVLDDFCGRSSQTISEAKSRVSLTKCGWRFERFPV